MDASSLLMVAVFAAALGVVLASAFWIWPWPRLQKRFPWLEAVLLPLLTVGGMYLSGKENSAWLYALGGGSSLLLGLALWMRRPFWAFPVLCAVVLTTIQYTRSPDGPRSALAVAGGSGFLLGLAVWLAGMRTSRSRLSERGRGHKGYSAPEKPAKWDVPDSECAG